MDSLRTRPRLTSLEDRLTPAVSPAQVFAAVNQTQAGGQVLGFIAENPQFLTLRVYQPFARTALTSVADNGDRAAADLNQFLSDLQAQAAANPAQAVALAPVIAQAAAAKFQAQTVATVARLDLNSVNQALGIQPTSPLASDGGAVSPPPVSPPVSPPAPVTDDSGMSNTIPDISSAEFRDIGNGVRVRDEVVGSGAAVQSNSSVQVYYTGYLTNGTVFDSVRSPSSPATFSTSRVIPGFAAGLIGMQPGGVRDIVIPPSQGYGAAGTSRIPPNSTLVFQIKLVSVTNPS